MSDGSALYKRPTLPVLSNGERETLDTRTLEGIGGSLADVAQAPRVRIHDAVESAREEGFETLQRYSIRELLEQVADAGRRFEGIGPVGTRAASSVDNARALSPRRVYEERVARATGLPIGWVHVSAHWLGYGLRHAAETLRAQSPTSRLDVYDDPTYERETTVGLAFAPRIRALGAVMSANDPAVYAWPVLALAMEVPVVLRPLRRDPFTAVRLARALLAAGVPESAVHVLPGPRDVGETIVRENDHSLIFGGENTVAEYQDNPAVEAYGPGRSIAIVARQPTERELDTLARGITRAGGRTCYNLSRIVAVEDCDADALADALARRVVKVTGGPVTDPETDVPSFLDPEYAQRVVERAADAGEDVTERYRDGPRYTTHDSCNMGRDGGSPASCARLAPMVVRTAALVEERPFQFAGVIRRDPTGPRDLLSEFERAYLGTVVGSDRYERAFAHSPHVRKVHGGAYPPALDLRETHETYLADFCYTTATYDPS